MGKVGHESLFFGGDISSVIDFLDGCKVEIVVGDGIRLDGKWLDKKSYVVKDFDNNTVRIYTEQEYEVLIVGM